MTHLFKQHNFLHENQHVQTMKMLFLFQLQTILLFMIVKYTYFVVIIRRMMKSIKSVHLVVVTYLANNNGSINKKKFNIT